MIAGPLRQCIRLLFALQLIFIAEWALAANATPLNIVPNGPAETVFSWRKDRCSIEHIPDSPARAFRSITGQVRLMAAHYVNVFLVGPSVDRVRPDCQAAYSAAMHEHPENFDARTWLQTFYTEDGQTIYSLGSADYHGIWFGRCIGSDKENPSCWRSAIVLAVSTDGGATFVTARPPAHVVARAPFLFEVDEPGKPLGFFTTSNILRRGNSYVSLIFTFGYEHQFRGNCLIQTEHLQDPHSWKAWDGDGFSVSFPDPKDPQRLERKRHTCKTVDGLSEPVRALLWHERTKQFVAIFSSRRRVPHGDGYVIRSEFWSSTSADLLHWSAARQIFADDSPRHCSAKPVLTINYPSIIDPLSEDINFGTLSDTAYLYFTRYNSAQECRMNMDRDLVRIPIRIAP